MWFGASTTGPGGMFSRPRTRSVRPDSRRNSRVITAHFPRESHATRRGGREYEGRYDRECEVRTGGERHAAHDAPAAPQLRRHAGRGEPDELQPHRLPRTALRPRS